MLKKIFFLSLLICITMSASSSTSSLSWAQKLGPSFKKFISIEKIFNIKNGIYAAGVLFSLFILGSMNNENKKLKHDLNQKDITINQLNGANTTLTTELNTLKQRYANLQLENQDLQGKIEIKNNVDEVFKIVQESSLRAEQNIVISKDLQNKLDILKNKQNSLEATGSVALYAGSKLFSALKIGLSFFVVKPLSYVGKEGSSFVKKKLQRKK